MKKLICLIDVCKMGHGKTKREVIDIVSIAVSLKGKDGGKGLYEDSYNYPCVRLMAYLTVELML